MGTNTVLQQGDMDAKGVCSEKKAEQPAVVVVPTPEEERLAEGGSAVVAEPLTAGDERLAEGGSAVVAEPLTAGDAHVSVMSVETQNHLPGRPELLTNETNENLEMC